MHNEVVAKEHTAYATYMQWKAWDRTPFGSITRKNASVYSCEIRRAGITLSPSSTVLEVGFGNGTFAAWVTSRTSNYYGTELNSDLVAKARRAGYRAYPATLDLQTIEKGLNYDLIIMLDVLEHLDTSQIVRLLNSARASLATNGAIVFRVPSGDSPFSGRCMNGDITHKTLLGTLSIYQLAKMSGLKVFRVSDEAFPIRGFGIVGGMIRAFVKLVRYCVSTFIRIFFLGNKPSVIYPNLVAVLKQDTDHNTET